MCFFDREALEYGGLCLRPSLIEKVRGKFDLSDEELTRIGKEKAEYHKNGWRRTRDKNLERDPVGARQKEADHARAWRQNNPEAWRQTMDKSNTKRRDAGLDNHLWHCEVCHKDYAVSVNLEKHLHSKAHRDECQRADSAKKPDPSHQRWYCEVCDTSYLRPATRIRDSAKPHV